MGYMHCVVPARGSHRVVVSTVMLTEAVSTVSVEVGSQRA